MSDKRYQVETSEWWEISLKDNITKKYPFSLICENLDEFEALLNEVNNVCAELNKNWEQTLRFENYNQELVQRSIKYEGTIEELKNEIKKLKKENNELNSIKRFADNQGINIFNIDEAFHKCWDDNGKLVKENEQLKQTIDEIGTYDKEEFLETEHINNIYKELGFKGVIDYAKDQLTDYGVVKEVQKGLWVMVTGGWSDHEHWIHCLNNPISIFKMKHYCAYETGGAFYYTEKPHKDMEIILKKVK